MRNKTIAVVAAWVLAGALVSGCKQEKGVNAESPAPTTVTPTAPPGPFTAPAAPDTAFPTPGTPQANSAENLAALKVKNALLTSKQPLAAKDITVSYHDGAFHLRGTVPTAAQKSTAEKIAKQTAGTTPVMNHLTVSK